MVLHSRAMEKVSSDREGRESVSRRDLNLGVEDAQLSLAEFGERAVVPTPLRW